MSLSWLKPLQTVSLIGAIVCCLILSISLGHWLTPSPSDIRLSFEQTSAAETERLPQEALDNHMPQLGKFPYWVDGKLTQVFGKYSPHVLRYVFFLLSLGLMFYLFIRFIKPPDESPTEWSLVFLLSLSGSFFLAIKFFFWLDYVVTIPLSLALAFSMRRNSHPIIIFILIMMIHYVKISAVFIILTFFGMFVTTEIIKKYKIPISAAVIISILIFLSRSGVTPLGDRGGSIFRNFPGYFLTGLNFIFAPWHVLGIFDKSVQRLVTDVGPVLLLKKLCFLTIIVWLSIRKTPGILFRFFAILGGFFCTLLLLRDVPTIHDFSAYSGVIELGFLSLVWIFYRSTHGKARAVTLLTLLIVAGIQYMSWINAIQSTQSRTSKVSLAGKLLNLTQNGRPHLFLFCSDNVGEFEYALNNVNIRYLLRESPPSEKDLLSARPAIFLIPERCQHEVVTPLMKQKYSAIISGTGAKFLEKVQIDRNQIYEIYEVR